MRIVKINKIKKMINETWTGIHIGNEGAKMISESLKINTTLTYLGLRCDEIEVKMNFLNK